MNLRRWRRPAGPSAASCKARARAAAARRVEDGTGQNLPCSTCSTTSPSAQPGRSSLCTTRPELLEIRPEWADAAGHAHPAGRTGRRRAGRLAPAPTTRRRARPRRRGRRGQPPVRRATGRPRPRRRRHQPRHRSPSVEALLASRLDPPPPETRALAQRAAVIGREFRPQALVALSTPRRQRAAPDAHRPRAHPPRPRQRPLPLSTTCSSATSPTPAPPKPTAPTSTSNTPTGLNTTTPTRSPTSKHFLGHHLEQAHHLPHPTRPTRRRNTSARIRAAHHSPTPAGEQPKCEWIHALQRSLSRGPSRYYPKATRRAPTYSDVSRASCKNSRRSHGDDSRARGRRRRRPRRPLRRVAYRWRGRTQVGLTQASAEMSTSAPSSQRSRSSLRSGTTGDSRTPGSLAAHQISRSVPTADALERFQKQPGKLASWKMSCCWTTQALQARPYARERGDCTDPGATRTDRPAGSRGAARLSGGTSKRCRDGSTTREHCGRCLEILDELGNRLMRGIYEQQAGRSSCSAGYPPRQNGGTGTGPDPREPWRDLPALLDRLLSRRSHLPAGPLRRGGALRRTRQRLSARRRRRTLLVTVRAKVEARRSRARMVSAARLRRR